MLKKKKKQDLLSGQLQAKHHRSTMYLCVCVYAHLSPSQQLKRPGDQRKAGFSLIPQDRERDR